MSERVVHRIRWTLPSGGGGGRPALAAAILALAAGDLGSESLTLSTFYPAPVAIYQEVVTTGLNGGTPFHSILARNFGNVGVGTANPNHKLRVQGSASGPDAPVNVFNNVAGSSQTAGVRFHTSSGWNVMLRTNQNNAWLELTDSAGTWQHRWATYGTAEVHYIARDNIGVQQDPLWTDAYSTNFDFNVEGNGKLRATGYVWGNRIAGCSEMSTTGVGGGTLGCGFGLYASWVKGLRVNGRWYQNLPDIRTGASAQQYNVNPAFTPANVKFFCCPF